MTAVGLVPHRERPRAHRLAAVAADWLARHDVAVRIPRPEADAAGLSGLAADPDDFAVGLDLVVSLGGDGTMLHTVALVYPEPVPVLGVNVGRLGYLTAMDADELEGGLPRLLDGSLSVSPRLVLEIEVDAGEPPRTWYALNEVALEKVRPGHMVHLGVQVAGTDFTTYAGDGVIVATPTGSTAYSFSSRGPIASPDLRCLLVTPVAPHMLFDRSLVLGADEALTISVADGPPVAVTVDGRELGHLGPGARVRCRGAAAPARIVAPTRPFHQILKSKFRLPDR